ncbi:MAG: preprotein translocase subunit SecY, partial [bacterium]|nr:preprotein translocase subunit SecY [bacterium]
YITASIIMQLLTMIFPQIKAIYHEEGEAGRRKFEQYTKYLAVPLAAVQAFALLSLLQRQQIIGSLGPERLFFQIIIIVAGTMFLMWLGDLITEKKIGNGISLLIFAGIVSQLPVNIRQAVLTYSPSQIPNYFAFAVIALIVIAGVVIINEGQRKIPVSYAKRVRGMKIYGGVSSYLPLRVNQAGVIPIIFAISILLFPQMISQVLAAVEVPLLAPIADFLQKLLQNQWLYGISYFTLVVLFTFFYTSITFEPNEISKNLQKQGGFIPGIRPGSFTAEFLSKILYRVTLAGAFFLGSIAVLPLMIQGGTGVAAFALGGTSLLIVVSVALETMKQIKAQLVMREYEGI